MYDTPLELLQHIRLGEDSALELKTVSWKGAKIVGPSRNDLADELAAMANANTAVCVLGVDDTAKVISGIDADKLDIVETWVREICNDVIVPPLDARILKVPLTLEDGSLRNIIRIDVPRSLFVHRSPGGYFKRIGSSKRQMSPESLARLFQQRSQTRLIRFDEQAVSLAPKQCLEKGLWEKFRTPLSSPKDEDFLLKLKLLTTDDTGLVCPTVSGVLMATHKPREYLTNAYIQAVAYRGTERNAAYQLDAKDIVGPLDVQIAEACHFVRRNMKIAAIKTPARIDIPQYDMQAVFEALVNAVAHRDYSIQESKIRLFMYADRLELFSPGAIPNTMTVDSLQERQASRNELITSLLARCPVPDAQTVNIRAVFMEKRGEGVPIIYLHSERLSGKRPEYRLIDDTELLLTIYSWQDTS